MSPQIRTLPQRHFIGKHLKMSLNADRTRELWTAFMPIRKRVAANLSANLYSIQLYTPGHFDNFDPSAEFEKWAAVETDPSVPLPPGLERLTLPAGEYAVFLHRGPVSESKTTFEYIFRRWLPGSAYRLDNRPHFEVMGEKYDNHSSTSEEEFWIPVKSKNNQPKK